MLLEINQIKVSDRIRKDYGNIEELALDIKENGLINPPVVTPEYELIAGERRLKALQYLDYQQIEVRVMTVKDALHQLKLEISENENRKDFSFSEKMMWAEQLKKEYEKIAKENQATSTGGENPQLRTEKHKAENIRTDVAVAQDLDMSATTYRKSEYIKENAPEEMIKQLDDGQLSINKAYTTLKQEKQQLENSNNVLKQEVSRKLQQQEDLQQQIKELKIQIENDSVPLTPPDDYTKVKEDLKKSEEYYKNLKTQYDSKIKRLQELEQQIKSMTELEPGEQYSKKLKDDTILFCVKVENFISQVGGLAYLSNHISELPPNEKTAYIKCVDLIEGWAQNIKVNMGEYLNL